MRKKRCGMQSPAAMLARAVSPRHTIRDPSTARLRLSTLWENWGRWEVLWKRQLRVSRCEVSLLQIVTVIYSLLLAL